MPSTMPLLVYWKISQRVHGPGMFGHVGPYCGIHSTLGRTSSEPVAEGQE